MSIFKIGLLGKSPPGKIKDIMNYLTRSKVKNTNLPDVFPASQAPIPKVKEDVAIKDAINRFVRDNPRTEKAGGGMLVQPSADGSRPGYGGKRKTSTEGLPQFVTTDELNPGKYTVRVAGSNLNEPFFKQNLSLEVTGSSVLGAIKGDMLSSNVDKVNMTPYGASVDKETINVNDSITTKDFIKFRFFDVVNRKFLIFRAILEGITDTVTPEYAEDRYIGRPDKLFVYQGVDRSISFTFSLYPKTKQELPILMEKLNYLVGLCYPSYTEGERMVSPFIELTMGDMFVETPGILSSLTVTVEEQSTWEIDEGLQFPHFIKAACEFRHIGEYAPATKGKHYDLNWIESDGSSYETTGAPNKNTYTDKSELGFPLYPERDEAWRKNVFEQLGQGKVGAEQ